MKNSTFPTAFLNTKYVFSNLHIFLKCCALSSPSDIYLTLDWFWFILISTYSEVIWISRPYVPPRHSEQVTIYIYIYTYIDMNI